MQVSKNTSQKTAIVAKAGAKAYNLPSFIPSGSG
jgi:hypothetical protein